MNPILPPPCFFLAQTLGIMRKEIRFEDEATVDQQLSTSVITKEEVCSDL